MAVNDQALSDVNHSERDGKPSVTKGAGLIPAPLVLFQAGSTSFLGMASGKMPTEQGRRFGHVVELSLDHVSGS